MMPMMNQLLPMGIMRLREKKQREIGGILQAGCFCLNREEQGWLESNHLGVAVFSLFYKVKAKRFTRP